MGDFSTQLKAFADKAVGNADKVVRKVVLDLGTAIVEKNPVGNPDMWKVNTTAAAYNREVFRFNAELRTNPDNLTKSGRLKPGRKVNDSMDIKKPAGYVGGRSRNSWMYSFGQPDTSQPHPMSQDYHGDQTGSESRARLNQVRTESDVFGVHYIANNLPYMHRLEFEGWSKQAPAGMVRVSLAEFRRFLTDAIQSLPK